MNQQLRGAVFMLLVGTAIVGGGGYLLYAEHQETIRAEPVDAEVVSTDWYSGSAPGEQSESHSVTIEYVYEYEGQEYESDVVYSGGSNSVDSEQAARETAAEYSAGDRVTAYVLPSDPAQAYLIERGPSLWEYGILAVGGFLLFVGLLNLGKQIRGTAPDVE